MAPADQVAILAEVLGRPLRYVDVPPDAARSAMTDDGMPPAVADAVLALLATALDPSAATVDPTVAKLIPTPPRTFGEWAQDHSAAFNPRW